MREVEIRTAEGGGDADGYQLLHKITASLMTACAVLCIVTARGAAVHDLRVLQQVRPPGMEFVAPNQARAFLLD